MPAKHALDMSHKGERSPRHACFGPVPVGGIARIRWSSRSNLQDCHAFVAALRQSSKVRRPKCLHGPSPAHKDGGRLKHCVELTRAARRLVRGDGASETTLSRTSLAPAREQFPKRPEAFGTSHH